MMNPCSNSRGKNSVPWLRWFLITVLVGACMWLFAGRENVGAQKSVVASETNSPAPSRAASVAGNSPVLRPLRVALESTAHQWTDGDGKDPAIIRQLAHNEFEYARMTAENETIYRRQLVYRKQTMSAVAQHAIRSGEPIRELLIPGLDGKEFQVEVRELETTDGGGSGTFSGHILGQPDSMVTLAFKGGREAFTLISLADQIFLNAEPREPGELVVKKFDPAKYGGGDISCGIK